jgi:hypothetical protein
MNKIISSIISLLFIASFSFETFATNNGNFDTYYPDNQKWEEVADELSLNVSLIYAIALKETGKTFDGEFRPHPWAIGVGKDLSVGQYKHMSLYPESYDEAKLIIKSLMSQGYTNLGIGMMQINILHNPNIVENPLELLDTNINLDASKKVLKYCIKKSQTKVHILSCYSHGRIDSKKGEDYALVTLDYEEKYGNNFSDKIMPTGIIDIRSLSDIWMNIDKTTATEKSGSNKIEVF